MCASPVVKRDVARVRPKCHKTREKFVNLEPYRLDRWGDPLFQLFN
jgi:hypothetical protein